MGRAGSGRSHSSRSRSSGGHSSSRRSGGHRVGSSSRSRAGSGHSFSFHNSSSLRRTGRHYGGPGMPPPPIPHGGPGMPPPPRGWHRRRRYYAPRVSGGSSRVASYLMLIIVFVVIIAAFNTFRIGAGIAGSSSIPSSTINREKLDSGLSFDSNCIVDELGWFDSVSKAGTRLKSFYDKTGVQPYIVLLEYHEELSTDSQKEDYAQAYYDSHIDNEATFLYMYFAEQDTDNDVGYMCYVNGKQVNSVMDAEAVDIFWGYIDRYWYSDMSTDELFENAFNRTADTIMTKSKTTTDILFIVVIGIVIVAVIIAILIVMNTKRRHERERAEETQRILNTPLPNPPSAASSSGDTTATSSSDGSPLSK